MNTEKIWDFIEKYYPNYYTSEEITDNGDLRMILDGQDEEGTKAREVKEEIEELFADHFLDAEYHDQDEVYKRSVEEEVKRRYNESISAIYEKAIEGYLEAQKEKESVTMTFSISDVDQVMEDNDIDYPLTEYGKKKVLEDCRDNFDANATYWDNLLESISRIINKTEGIKP